MTTKDDTDGELDMLDTRFLDLAERFHKEMDDSGKSNHWKYLYDTKTVPIILSFCIQEANSLLAAERVAIEAEMGASEKPQSREQVGGKQVDNLDELKARADKAMYDLFYGALAAGEDEVLQRQFEHEPAYKHRYAKRCIDEATAAVIDLVLYGRKQAQSLSNPPKLDQFHKIIKERET